MKRVKWYFWIIAGIILLALIYMSWSKGFDSGFEEGYDYGYNESSYDSRDYYVNASMDLIDNSINESVNGMTLEFSNKCIKYFCENIFDSNYIEGSEETNNLGKCDGEEYKSVGALEECRMMFFGE